MSDIRLDPIAENDAHNILKWVNNTDVVGNIAAFRPYKPFTLEDEIGYVRAMQQSETDEVFSITDRESGRYLGQIGLHDIHWPSRVGRLSVIIGSKNDWGKGYGSAAISRLLNRVFRGPLNDSKRMHKVWLMVFESNTRAQAIYTRIGFRVEGRLREEYLLNKQYHTMIRMAVLRQEWNLK